MPAILRANGIKVGVVSNRRFARAAVEKSGLSDLFDTVVGLEDVENPKPHPEPILTALDILGVEPGFAVYVGDTDIDVKTVAAANTFAVGMTSGAFGRDALLRAGADCVCGELTEIPKFLGI